MGLGDWIMATSIAKRHHEATGRQVVFVNQYGRIQYSGEVFANNPRIAQTTVGTDAIINCPGMRPYIALKTEQRWTWKHWEIAPGELWLTSEERAAAEWAHGMVMVEPNTKVLAGNKAWPYNRWQDLMFALPDARFVQPMRVGVEGWRLFGAAMVVPTSFRQAIAILSHCRAFVGTEGALHHAAAALGIPAVVLWSEFISPEFTGYASQANLRHAGAPCGNRRLCDSCKQSMERITVAEVTTALRGVLNGAYTVRS